MKNSFKILIVSLLFYSCKTAKVSPESTKSVALLNKLEYATNDLFGVLNQDSKVSKNLNESEIKSLEDFFSNKESLYSFDNSECIGCDYSFANYNPAYKIEKGHFIHYGIKEALGTKHFVFNKKGKFITQFYAFQGYSKSRLEELITQEDKSVLTAVYPTKLTENSIYLEYFQYSNENDYDGWYNTLKPLHFNMMVNFEAEKPEMGFIFNGGLFSFQDNDENNNYRTVNFFEPTFSSTNNKTESVTINGYTSNASFYLLNINEDSDVEITINSNLKNESFDFSIVENTNYLSLNDYLTMEKPVFSEVKKSLKKGTYLIRVLNKHNGKIDDYVTPYYTLQISKSITQ